MREYQGILGSDTGKYNRSVTVTRSDGHSRAQWSLTWGTNTPPPLEVMLRHIGVHENISRGM
jgi:hypothetical protein